MPSFRRVLCLLALLAAGVVMGAATPLAAAPSLVAPRASAMPAIANGANLLQNGGFETGQSAPWSAYHANLAITTQAHSGSYALQAMPWHSGAGLYYIVDYAGDSPFGMLPKGIVATQPGAFAASVWVLATMMPGQLNQSVELCVRDGSATQVNGQNCAVAPATGGWQALSVVHNVAIAGNNVDLWIGGEYYQQGDSFILDDAALTGPGAAMPSATPAGSPTLSPASPTTAPPTPTTTPGNATATPPPHVDTATPPPHIVTSTPPPTAGLPTPSPTPFVASPTPTVSPTVTAPPSTPTGPTAVPAMATSTAVAMVSASPTTQPLPPAMASPTAAPVAVPSSPPAGVAAPRQSPTPRASKPVTSATAICAASRPERHMPARAGGLRVSVTPTALRPGATAVISVSYLSRALLRVTMRDGAQPPASQTRRVNRRGAAVFRLRVPATPLRGGHGRISVTISATAGHHHASRVVELTLANLILSATLSPAARHHLDLRVFVAYVVGARVSIDVYAATGRRYHAVLRADRQGMATAQFSVAPRWAGHIITFLVRASGHGAHGRDNASEHLTYRRAVVCGGVTARRSSNQGAA